MTVAFTSWRRYGHDRLHVSVDDRKLGFRDMKTGLDHPDDPVDARLLTGLVTAHLLGEESEPSTSEMRIREWSPTSTPTPERPPTVDKSDQQPVSATSSGEPERLVWTDLADVRPGQLARQRAEEEWEARKAAYPVRARLGRLLNVHTDERAWRIGADGEEAVGAQLGRLARRDLRWRVLHAVPVGEHGSDIDHVVIGPAGVFTINAKHHAGAKIWVGKDQLRVNGHVEPYIRNSRFEAKRASRMLTAATGSEVRVDALIVLFGVADITIKAEPGEKDGSAVHVKYRRQSIRWLTKQPAVLTSERIDEIYEQARRSTTWVSTL